MRNTRLITLLLGTLVLLALGLVLRMLAGVLLPFVIAILFAILFKPMVVYLTARRVPMVLALLVVLFWVSLILFIVGLILLLSTQSFLEALPRYEARFDGLLDQAVGQLGQWADRLGVPVEDLDWTEVVQFSSITAAVTSGLGSFFNFVSTTVLVLLFLFFILAGSGSLVRKLDRAFPTVYAFRMSTIVENIENQVRQYLVTKTFISLLAGLTTYGVLLGLGVDFPLIWGFLTFLLHYIPNIGGTLAVAFPFVLALLQFETFAVPVLVALILITVQMGLGNVVEPRVMAFSLNLSSLLILVALIFWGWLWGLWGMFLAVPLTASIKIVFENIATLRPLAVLMSELPTAPVGAPGQGDGAVRGAEDVAARRPEGTNPGDQPVSPL
jgi:predicted PurR-regulated permease PerM